MCYSLQTFERPGRGSPRDELGFVKPDLVPHLQVTGGLVQCDTTHGEFLLGATSLQPTFLQLQGPYEGLVVCVTKPAEITSLGAAMAEVQSIFKA